MYGKSFPQRGQGNYGSQLDGVGNTTCITKATTNQVHVSGTLFTFVSSCGFMVFLTQVQYPALFSLRVCNTTLLYCHWLLARKYGHQLAPQESPDGIGRLSRCCRCLVMMLLRHPYYYCFNMHALFSCCDHLLHRTRCEQLERGYGNNKCGFLKRRLQLG